MRKILIGGAILVVVVSLLLALRTTMVRNGLEAGIRADCPGRSPGEGCLARMRAMGHIWSRAGEMEKARLWYLEGAERGDPAAMFHLAWAYEQAALDDLKMQMRQQAARRDASISDQPRVFRRNVGKRNIDLAKRWYQASADRGFAPAMNNLGTIYLHGHGGLQDQPRAFQLFMSAAKLGNPIAAWNVAIAYTAALGVEQNTAEAEKWATWTPPVKVMDDLAEPTLARTVVFSTTLSAGEREKMRASARIGAPVTMSQRPMKPDPSLPTFHEAASMLPNMGD